MGLEVATFINQLVPTNPIGAVDPKSQGDDHLRLIKSTIQNTFPNITGAVTATHTRLSEIGGATQALFLDGSAVAPGVAFNGAGGANDGFYRLSDNRIGVSLGGVLSLDIATTFIENKGLYFGPNGSIANPTYSFATRQSDGMYSVAANQVGFATNGVRRVYIADVGSIFDYPLFIPDGSAASPGMQFSGHAIGFYRIGTNNVGIAVGGSLGLGVSSTAITAKSQVQAQIGNAGLPSYSFEGNNTNGMFYNSGSSSVNFAVGGTSYVSISSSLINLVTPSFRVDGIHNGTLPAGATNQFIASGTYTPTISNTTNVQASTSGVCQWLRVGNVVTVSGVLQIDPTAGGGTQFDVSLPIASSTTQLGGTGAWNTTPPADFVLIRSNGANAQFQFTAGTTANATLVFQFTYLVA